MRVQTATIFRSMHSRNYRFFFYGQMVSLIGTWLQTVALGWIVYTITKSPAEIGLITAVQFVPVLLGSIHAGLIADRFDKRTILIWTQSLFTIQAAALTGVALAHVATLPVLYALAIVQGAITTVDNPTRQAFVSEMVSEDLLANAGRAQQRHVQHGPDSRARPRRCPHRPGGHHDLFRDQHRLVPGRHRRVGGDAPRRVLQRSPGAEGEGGAAGGTALRLGGADAAVGARS